MTGPGLSRKALGDNNRGKPSLPRGCAAIWRFGPLRLATLVWLVIVLTALATPSHAQRRKPAEVIGVGDYRSRNFLIHTDLTPKAAAALLDDLETMLKLISVYWGRPSQGIIQCNVVKDLEAWPRERLAQFDPAGLVQIRGGAGVCISHTISSGNKFIAKSIVYAVAKGGVPQHEAVHAYCAQTFGRTGPIWYAEGMAEMGQYWINGKKGVNAYPLAIEYLKQNRPKTLAELVIVDERLGGTWQDYAWWWSLCHMLENNPNYSKQFRLLGNGILANNGMSFQQVFGPVARQVTFEYNFFMQHLESGFRVELCAWDWKKKFLPMKVTGRTTAANVLAARGWQPTGLTVSPDIKYEYTTKGKWKTTKDGEPVEAGGDADGKGRLMGVLMRDYQLSKPFALATSGTFRFKVTADLYVRCNDEWPQLADNSGRISMRIKVKREKPSRPKEN